MTHSGKERGHHVACRINDYETEKKLSMIKGKDDVNDSVKVNKES